MRAVNRAGESDPSDPSLPHKARAKNSPPRIDRHAMMDIRILAGEPLNIKVSDGSITINQKLLLYLLNIFKR